VATEAMEHEERGHSARTLILIFLICIVVCAVFFSMGFLVGFNERRSVSAPATEVVTPPPAIPPTINAPLDSGQAPSPTPAITPDTEVIPPGGGPTPPAAKPTVAAPPGGQPQPGTKSSSNPPAPPTPAAREGGAGIILQVAALSNREDADHLVEILKGRGYPVFMVTPQDPHATDSLFHVQVGPFKTRDDANNVRNKLTQEGFKPFIKH